MRRSQELPNARALNARVEACYALAEQFFNRRFRVPK